MPSGQQGMPILPAHLRGWLSSWAWGTRTAADVVRDAARSVQDTGVPAAHPTVRRLAKCSTNIGNAERLVEPIVPDFGLPQPVRVEDSLIEWVLPPDALLQWLARPSVPAFRLHVGGDPDAVQAFRQAFLARPCASEFKNLRPYLRGKTPADLRRHLQFMFF